MSSYFVRMSGNMYGPFNRDQMLQMTSSGRINGQTEVSLDRVNWSPAAAVLEGPASRPPNAPAAPFGTGGSASLAMSSSADKKRYLELLRNNTRYPFYRTTILICSILGYVVAALPLIAFVVRVIWSGLGSVLIYEPFAAFFVAGLIAALVTVFREMFSMYADFVDSTLEHHSKSAQ